MPKRECKNKLKAGKEFNISRPAKEPFWGVFLHKCAVICSKRVGTFHAVDTTRKMSCFAKLPLLECKTATFRMQNWQF